MPTMSEALREALESDCSHSLEPVMAARRPEDLAALLELVTKPSNTEQRLKALHALGRWQDEAAVPIIARVIPELNEVERSRAIDALGRIGGPEALDTVLKHTTDPSPHVRKFVVHALKRADAPKAREALKLIKQNDPVEFVRASVK